MEKEVVLTRGGIYLAKLNPARASEIGKVRPVVVLNAQAILDATPPVTFICPLSSKSQSQFGNIHFKLVPRDNLGVESFALVEHCRAISSSRFIHPRLAQISEEELLAILSRIGNLIGL